MLGNMAYLTKTVTPRWLSCSELQKTIKYCTSCKRDYHTEDDYYLKHPYLAPKSSNNKPARKLRRGASSENESNNNKDTVKTKESSYFTEGQLVAFMATQNLSIGMFNIVWVLDCGCSQHVTPDGSVCVTFRKLFEQQPVKG